MAQDAPGRDEQGHISTGVHLVKGCSRFGRSTVVKTVVSVCCFRQLPSLMTRGYGNAPMRILPNVHAGRIDMWHFRALDIERSKNGGV